TRRANRGPTALNCLKTVMEVLENDRTRIALPNSMIRARLAHIHQWAGDALLEEGQSGEARKHLLKSLWHRPLQPRTGALLLRASLPNGVGNRLQCCWRWLKTVAPVGAAK